MNFDNASPTDIVIEYARLFGVKAIEGREKNIIAISNEVEIILFPTADQLHQYGVGCDCAELNIFIAKYGKSEMWGRLRSLKPAIYFEGVGVEGILVDSSGRAVWAWLPRNSGGLLLIGTDLAGDQIQYRQGDPSAAEKRPTEPFLGYSGERPIYLFESQLESELPHERMADWWMWLLRDALVRLAGVMPDNVLPRGAKGIVIVTGDDDQAPLEAYRNQIRQLAGIPMTYFLHPLTKHTSTTMNELASCHEVEWGIHPDALDRPDQYEKIYAEQVKWYIQLTGMSPRLVRNHGFLNDGYWGHARSWIAHGTVGSSNLPGLNGRVLNSSLLPAPLVLNGKITNHWSILTAFGDGVLFALNWTDRQATNAIVDEGNRILRSGVPGVLVFNLHPENYIRSKCMVDGIRKLIDSGFVAMTLGSALEWFMSRGKND